MYVPAFQLSGGFGFTETSATNSAQEYSVNCDLADKPTEAGHRLPNHISKMVLDKGS